MKKICSFFLILSTITILFTACGRPKQEATETVKAVYDLYILGNTAGVSGLGVSDAELRAALDSYNENLKTSIRDIFTASSLDIEEGTLDQICEARKGALAEMTSSYELVSVSKKSAVVKLTTTYFDETSIHADAVTATQSEAENSNITDYDEYMLFVSERYAQRLIEGYGNVTPSEDTKEISVNCVIVDNVWMPEDMSEFGTSLGLAISGQ